MQGPVYRQSSAGPGMIEGFWSDEAEAHPEREVEFEVRFHSSEPDRRYYGWQGFQAVETDSDPSSQLAHGWKPLGRYRKKNGDSGAGAYYVDPDSVPLLSLWEDLIEGNRIFCDGRQLTDRELTFYHTLPFFGWLQNTSIIPPPYKPRRRPWANSEGDPLFCLIHGFTGDPENWIHVVNILDTSSCSYCVPLLPGHSLPPNQFANYGKPEWTDSVEVMLEQVTEKFNCKIGIGLSMGGALVLRNWEEFDAVVLINTPVDVPTWKRFLLPLVNLFKSNHYPSDSEKVLPIRSIREMGSLLREVSGSLSEIEIPVLIFSNHDDETVPQGHSRYLNAMLPNSKRIAVESGGHESPTDPEVARILFREMIQWFSEKEIPIGNLYELQL